MKFCPACGQPVELKVPEGDHLPRYVCTACATIHYETRGVIKIPVDGLDRLAAGEMLPFEETYVRTTPRFETADERYSWLSEIVAVGYNVLSPDHIDYRIYRLL